MNKILAFLFGKSNGEQVIYPLFLRPVADATFLKSSYYPPEWVDAPQNTSKFSIAFTACMEHINRTLHPNYPY